MRQTMEIEELLNVLTKRKWIVIVSAIIFMIIGIIYSAFLVTPTYRADTTLIVSGSNSDLALDIGTISVNQKLVVTYGKIVKSRSVLETVINELKLDTNYEKFLPKVSAEPVDDTEILRISVKDKNKNQAVIIADKIAEVFKKEAGRILKANNIEVVDRAASTENTINRSPVIIIILAIMAGVVIGILLTLLIDYMDNTLKTEEDIEKYLNLSVIGSVPDFKVIEKD